MNTNNLIAKYQHYGNEGCLVLSVTLSTYIKSPTYAHSDRMRHMWDQHFIRRVRRYLPWRAHIDHDWIVEMSPDGYFHYHGFIAVDRLYRARIWRDGRLNPRKRPVLAA